MCPNASAGGQGKARSLCRAVSALGWAAPPARNLTTTLSKIYISPLHFPCTRGCSFGPFLKAHAGKHREMHGMRRWGLIPSLSSQPFASQQAPRLPTPARANMLSLSWPFLAQPSPRKKLMMVIKENRQSMCLFICLSCCWCWDTRPVFCWKHFCIILC